jgi:hypothetical protein
MTRKDPARDWKKPKSGGTAFGVGRCGELCEYVAVCARQFGYRFLAGNGRRSVMGEGRQKGTLEEDLARRPSKPKTSLSSGEGGFSVWGKGLVYA